MRKLLFLIPLAISLAMAPSIVTGCKHTPTQQKVAVNTLLSLHLTVDAALDGYLDLVRNGTLATNAVPKVLASYTQFQIAFNSAVLLVASNTNSAAPPNVGEAATSFLTAITSAKKGGL